MEPGGTANPKKCALIITTLKHSIRVLYLTHCLTAQGEVVVNVGSRGGIDVFLAAKKVGPYINVLKVVFYYRSSNGRESRCARWYVNSDAHPFRCRPFSFHGFCLFLCSFPYHLREEIGRLTLSLFLGTKTISKHRIRQQNDCQ